MHANNAFRSLHKGSFNYNFTARVLNGIWKTGISTHKEVENEIAIESNCVVDVPDPETTNAHSLIDL